MRNVQSKNIKLLKYFYDAKKKKNLNVHGPNSNKFRIFFSPLSYKSEIDDGGHLLFVSLLN